MQKFLRDIVLFLVLAGCLLAGITYITDRGLKRSDDKYYQTWNEISQDSVNAGLLIMGNSHAWVQVDPQIMDSALHTNSYNLGINAYLFDMQYARYLFYRKHNKRPSVIVQCIDLFEFDKSRELIDKPQFLPYIQDADIAAAAENAGMPVWYRYLPFLKWQENGRQVSKGIAQFFSGKQLDSATLYKGYSGSHKVWDEGMFNWFMEQNKHYVPELNDTVFRQFTTFLTGCRRDSIQVIMVLTPHYYKFTQSVVMLSSYKQLMQLTAERYGAHFLDFTTDTLCRDSSKFYNATHLNKAGAELFSRKLATKIAQLRPVTDAAVAP